MANRVVSMVVNKADEAQGGPGGSITVLTDITLTKMHEVLQSACSKAWSAKPACPS
jgi:hypothetical protein